MSVIPIQAAVGPEEGDVIITTLRTATAETYVLHEWRCPPQLSCTSHEDAIDLATAYAREQRVSVWYGDGQEFVLAEYHRVSTVRRRNSNARESRSVRAATGI